MNVISTEHFTHWLKGQPREATFVYINNEDCLIARYLKAHGLTAPRVSAWHGNVRVGGEVVAFDIPRDLVDVLACQTTTTYGAILERLGEAA